MTLKDDPLVLLGWSCPYCGAPTKLVDDTEIYGRSYGTSCYVCKPCGAWVGCHKGTDKALGRIANKELRELKRQARTSLSTYYGKRAASPGQQPMRYCPLLSDSRQSKPT